MIRLTERGNIEMILNDGNDYSELIRFLLANFEDLFSEKELKGSLYFYTLKSNYPPVSISSADNTISKLQTIFSKINHKYKNRFHIYKEDGEHFSEIHIVLITNRYKNMEELYFEYSLV